MPSTVSDGALRTATALLWANGGFAIKLRLPDLATSGDDAEQLGLCSPAFQDAVIGPAAWRQNGQDQELLLAADSVLSLVGSQALDSARALFETAIGILVGDAFYTVVKSTPVLAYGAPCAYRIQVEGSTWI